MPKAKRVHVIFECRHMEAVELWRHRYRLTSHAEAIRSMIEYAEEHRNKEWSVRVEARTKEGPPQQPA